MTDPKHMCRHVVPVDDQPHTFVLTGDIRAVATGVTDTSMVVEFWAESTGETPTKRTFQVFGTGQPIPRSAQWRGTTARAIDGWHLYELKQQ